jgi:hypothetical protein
MVDGLSFETAISVNNILEEYMYIEHLYGVQGESWQLKRQLLTTNERKEYDILEIVLQDGTEKSFYFDISSFYGREFEFLRQKYKNHP